MPLARDFDAAQGHRCPRCLQILPEIVLGITRVDRENAGALGISDALYSFIAGADFREEVMFRLDLVDGLLRGEAGEIQLTRPAPTLVLTVGLRTGILVRDALIDRSVAIWEVGSASALTKISIPAWADEVVVVDTDASVRCAAETLAGRCATRDIACTLMLPPSAPSCCTGAATAEVA